MEKLLDIFNKHGGFKLLQQYIKGGAFFTAICELVLLGRSRKALEILRLATSYKINGKLAKKYKKFLKQFDDDYDNQLCHKQSNIVWVCWLQGIEHAPKVVQKCYESLKENLIDKEIILVTANNMNKYVEFPDYIIDKWTTGKITFTHMTDLLRLELLIKYGGTWIDATVLCTRTSNEIPDYYFKSDLFFYQILKPGRDGQTTVLSSWFLSACTNNKILMATRYLCYEYWKNNNDMMDYFLLHDFFQMVLEYYEEEWAKVIPVSNSTPHILLLKLFDEYDEKMMRYIIDQTPFHKLSYKFSDEQKKLPNTYYKRILGDI